MENNNEHAKPSAEASKQQRQEGEREQPTTNNQSSSDVVVVDDVTQQLSQTRAPSSQRAPFSDLNQIDADLALARTLQEQERAYMMLRMSQDGIHYGSWEAGTYYHDDEDDFDDPDDEDEDEDEDDNENDEDDEQSHGYDEEDAFDVHAHADGGEDDVPAVEIDPNAYSSDEAYARALQEAEEREMAARLLALAGINDRELEDTDDHGGDSQESWEDVDPDELSYEELIALGEVVGTESRGLAADKIASLPSVSYKPGSTECGSNDSCVICRLEYEDNETLTMLSCKHSYHPECINNWLKINKVCPVCSADVSTSGNS